MIRKNPSLLFLYSAAAVVFLWSAWQPRDRLTWVLEAAPAVLGALALLATRRRFPLTPLALQLIAVHMVILCVGGKYTYAEVPVFNWLRDTLGFARNHYDRLGHLAQGFVPAILVREILLRRSPLVRGKWLFFLVVCVCLAISAVYELVEWCAAMVHGEAATAFLGSQGDDWDTQKDMALALLGAILAQVGLARIHDRQLSALGTKK